MELRTYLDLEKTAPADFAEAIGVTTTALYRYMTGERLPRRDVMARISSKTCGKVSPNDFHRAQLVAV